MFSEDIINKAGDLVTSCQARKLMLVTAESCTGGLVASLLTAISGSSASFERGFVTYSNEAKQEMLGVPKALIDEHGAVSEPVAKAMAEGALKHSHAHLSISVTGIAGPTGGSEHKPVGLVYIASAIKGGATVCRELRLKGNRETIRFQSINQSLDLLSEQLGSNCESVAAK